MSPFRRSFEDCQRLIEVKIDLGSTLPLPELKNLSEALEMIFKYGLPFEYFLACEEGSSFLSANLVVGIIESTFKPVFYREAVLPFYDNPREKLIFGLEEYEERSKTSVMPRISQDQILYNFLVCFRSKIEASKMPFVLSIIENRYHKET